LTGSPFSVKRDPDGMMRELFLLRLQYDTAEWQMGGFRQFRKWLESYTTTAFSIDPISITTGGLPPSPPMQTTSCNLRRSRIRLSYRGPVVYGNVVALLVPCGSTKRGLGRCQVSI